MERNQLWRAARSHRRLPAALSIPFLAFLRITLTCALGVFLAAAPTASAGAQQLPELTAEQSRLWGLYAEMAERDFFVEESNGPWAASFRWEVAGEVLIEQWFKNNPLRSHVERVHRLDASTGIIESRRRGYAGTSYTRAEPDGSIVAVRGRPAINMWRSGSNYVLGARALIGGTAQATYRPWSEATPFLREAMATRMASGRFRAPLRRSGTSTADSIGVTSVPQSAPISGPAVAAVTSPVVPPRVASGVPAGPRIALVIGVSAYGGLGDLVNPTNDARAVAETLSSLGFDVQLVLNPDQRALRQAISQLGERMSDAGRGATGLFFFAGHGIQARGINYLIPSGAQIVREADLALEAIPADTVLLQMQEAGVSTNILILDACRNMPLTRSFRNSARGLAQMDAPNGTFIAYSTAPGSVAADGEGANSPFATALVAEMSRPGQPIEAIFRNVRRSVLRDTDGLQTPWDSSSLLDPFYFVSAN